MGAELKYIIGLAFAMSLGILLLILSCALYNNWNPMFALIPFLLSPLPSYLFTGQCCQSDDVFSMDDSSAGKDWGYFVTSVFVVSGFGVILVMAHVDIIGSSAMGLALASAVFFYSSILGFNTLFTTESSSF